MQLFESGSSAVFSECGTYRYRLERWLGGDGPTAAICMVNPSTAGAETNDHTITKVLGFGRQFGFGRFIVVNKCAYKATDVKELKTAVDPIGPENDLHIRAAFKEADIHIVAWGSLSKLPPQLRTRWKDIVSIADECGAKLQCLGVTNSGDPLHPLMIGYDRQLIEWKGTP